MKNIKFKYLLWFSVLFIISCDPFALFIESEFVLSQESRLPKWFTTPENLKRENVSVTITFYATGRAKVALFGPLPDKRLIAEFIGTHRRPSQSRPGQYPGYTYIQINGIEELFEHRWRNNIMHIAEAPSFTEPERLEVLKEQFKKEESDFAQITNNSDKFFPLESLAELAYEIKYYEKARVYSKVLIDLANKYPDCCLSESALKTGNVILKKCSDK